MRGICFIEPMFQKVVTRQKTQTRRLVKINKAINEMFVGWTAFTPAGSFSVRGIHADGHYGESFFKMRYKIGDILYLKEPYFRVIDPITGPETLYKFDGDTFLKENSGGWKNKLFMPEKYARYFIEIKALMAHRIDEITNSDAWCEGVSDSPEYNCVAYFRDVWNKIHKKEGERWEDNPFVFAYKFELTEKPKT